jgi:membrane protein
MAAALSYYTIFSLPALLVVIIGLVSFVYGAQNQIHDRLGEEFTRLLGADAGRQVQEMVDNMERSGDSGLVARIIGLVTLIFGATGAFTQLQAALNTAWGVEPDPRMGGLRNFLIKRVLSFGMILGVAFLLLVSLLVTAVVQLLGDRISLLLPSGISTLFIEALNAGISFAIIALLFATIFKVLPDARIRWKDVLVGACATALLFVAGKSLIGLYLGRSNVGSAYGAAGSLALVLVWIYYSSMIVLLGAEFTQVWARRFGAAIEPEAGAVRIVREVKRISGAVAPQGHASKGEASTADASTEDALKEDALKEDASGPLARKEGPSRAREHIGEP